MMMKKHVFLALLMSLVLTAGAYAQVTIYDIQYTTAPSGDSPYAGQTVTTHGIVTAYESGTWEVFIQDGAGPWTGIMIYNPPITLALGDDVEVTGEIQEYYEMTEMTVASATILSSGNPLPAPEVIDTGETSLEQWEGLLLEYSMVTVTNPDLGYGEWEVSDGSGGAVINDLYSYNFTPVQDESLDYVIGLMQYNYSVFKLEPRDDEDIGFVEATPTPTPTGPTPTPVPPTPTPTGPTPTPQPVDQIKINEMYINSPGTDAGCFVELYLDGGVSLDGLVLVGVNGNNGADYNTINLTGYAIPSDGFFVIAMDGTVANADIVDAAANYQNGPDNLQLRQGSDVIDAIGYGDFSGGETFAGEGTPAPAFFTGEHSHSRYPDGADSENNFADFMSGNLTPGEANELEGVEPTFTPTPPITPTPTPTGPTPTSPPVFNIVINEVHVNPDGQDLGCYIELYKSDAGTVTLDGYYLVGINGFDGSEYQVIPISGSITGPGYFVIAQDATVANYDMIDTNADYQNGPDCILLKTGSTVVDAVGYGDFSGGETPCGEGSPATYDSPTNNLSLSRLPDGADTDDNFADFGWGDLTPGAMNVAGQVPTFTPTPPDVPTYTPTSEVPTPTPTEPACTVLGCTIVMPGDAFHAGDDFYISVDICNPSQETVNDVPLFVILEVYGTYFFAPQFNDYGFYNHTLMPGLETMAVLDTFTWPDAGSGEATWYAAMTNAEVTMLYGVMDIFPFSWQ